jgi:hypothetical protein
MKPLLLSALTLALPALAIGVPSPSVSPSIRGAWQAVEVTMPGPGGRTIRNVQPNLTIITAKHYSRVEVHADTPRPTLTDVATASADDLRAAWGPFVAEAGTYEVSGNSLTMRPIVAKNPAAMDHGAYTTYSYKVAGDTLWVTYVSTDKGPVTNPPTIKAIRVE